ncbi:MAG: hypothetical protein K2M78_10235 [Lachnospiraceae bacterium]|nr:hypothetical protein [Lachnospiraceae bacterium]
MKRKKCITGKRRKIKIGILTSLAIILCVGIAFGYIRFTRGYQMFRAPEHEAAAVSGVPDVVDTYQELPVREGYAVGIDTVPVWKDGILSLNVANKEGNIVWFLVRVYQNERLIAKSGMLYAGEYLANLPCDTVLQAGDTILVQIAAYEPQTYHSEGVARISCQVAAE